MIPYGKQDIDQADIDAVSNVLRSDFLTQGPQVPIFERKVSKYCGAKYGVAVNSATSALHIACLSLGLGEGDWLWTSPNSFVASANCAWYCNARVDFVDIDPKTYNLSVDALEEKLIRAELEGRLPKILIPVHFAGQSCNMRRLHFLSQKYGFKIIEDASHAIGGKYLGESIGGCKYSDITVFSFHPVKIITTAEGGLATTNDRTLAKHMQLLRSHGITRDPDLMICAPDEAWYYQQTDLGFNYRMTDLQAALGISQMDRLDSFIKKRHDLQRRYDAILKDMPVILPYQDKEGYSALHLYPIQIDLSSVKKNRKKIFDELRQAGIGVNVHYIPIYSHPYYQSIGFKKRDFYNMENYYRQAISIPMFHSMTIKQQDKVCSALRVII